LLVSLKKNLAILIDMYLGFIFLSHYSPGNGGECVRKVGGEVNHLVGEFGRRPAERCVMMSRCIIRRYIILFIY
jgi:hypothetical protein